MIIAWAIAATITTAICGGCLLRACASRDEAWRHAAAWQQRDADHVEQLRQAGLL